MLQPFPRFGLWFSLLEAMSFYYFPLMWWGKNEERHLFLPITRLNKRSHDWLFCILGLLDRFFLLSNKKPCYSSWSSIFLYFLITLRSVLGYVSIFNDLSSWTAYRQYSFPPIGEVFFDQLQVLLSNHLILKVHLSMFIHMHLSRQIQLLFYSQ